MAVIHLSIYVSNLSNVLGLFDKLRFFRSTSGEGGPYTQITADSATAATLTGSIAGSFSLNGKNMLFKVDGGAEQEVVFASADPVNVDLAIIEINDQATGITATEDTGAVVISSDTTGTSSIIEFTGGTALAELGFTSGDIDGGQDADLTLSAGTDEYQYDDLNGDISNYYQSQYVNSGTQTGSTLSDPVQGDVSSIIPSADLITAKIDLANLDGTPIEGTVVSIYNIYVPPIVISDIGVIGRTVELVTDAVGHAETMLVKGAQVDVAIAGSSIVRQIVVPSTGTEFNLLDEIAAADDLFQIQTPTIPAAVRRS